MSSSGRYSQRVQILCVLCIGGGCSLALSLLGQVFLAGMGIIITGTVLLGIMISADATKNARPFILADLSPNHREIIVENAGTSTAVKMEVTAAGIDEPWHVECLPPDASIRLSLPRMVESLIVEVTYENETSTSGRRSKAFRLGRSEPEQAEQDPFRPLFPLFGWKK